MKKPIAIIAGEPNSISSEIIFKCWKLRKKFKHKPFIIIGISDYENTNASALYADSDAKMFYDYANLKLGILSSNIKELVGNNAKRLDIFKSVRSFLLKRTIFLRQFFQDTLVNMF